MKFEKITAPSQRDLFIRKIQEMILSGELKKGERMPSERELADSLGVSRTIVNTGIAVLEEQGFLEVVPRQGVFVTDYKRTANVDTLNAIMKLKGDVLRDTDIRSILEIRWALERLTVKNALAHLSEENLEQLKAIIEKIREAKTPMEAAELALEFQRLMAEFGENSMLSLIIVSFRAPCLAMWVRFIRIYGIQTLYEHTKKSFELLARRDYDKALEWIENFSKEAMDGKFTLYDKDLRGAADE